MIHTNSLGSEMGFFLTLLWEFSVLFILMFCSTAHHFNQMNGVGISHLDRIKSALKSFKSDIIAFLAVYCLTNVLDILLKLL